MPAPQNQTPHSRWRHIALATVLSLAAFGAASWVSRLAPFQRISAVFSDEISRSLGVTSTGPVVLVRIGRDFTKPALQTLLARAIPALVDNYRAAVLGVDIDFSRGYEHLAKSFTAWSGDYRNRDSSAHVVWAAGFDRPEAPGESTAEPEGCVDCAGQSCNIRLRPRPVFRGSYADPNYGLAYVWTDGSGIARASFRYVCNADSTQRLYTFHYRLVESYCGRFPEIPVCDELQHRQNTTRLNDWFEAETIDLCSLVECNGEKLGAPKLERVDRLKGKIVILYSDMEGNDEHGTPFTGTRKGAEIVASLAMNELLHGAPKKAYIKTIEVALEIAMAVILYFVFHWRFTERWAVLLAGVLFILLLYFVPNLSAWIPDFRNYALAVVLAFAIEAWFKAAYQSIAGAFARP
jgi:hypothetical protein